MVYSQNVLKLVAILVASAMALTCLTGCEEAPPDPVQSSSKHSHDGDDHDHGNDHDRGDHDGHDDHEGHDSDAGHDDSVEREAAKVGVGKKGRGYGGGVVTEPIRQMFRAEQKIQLTNMKHAMDLYKAQYGKLPKTHESFMKDIIEANSIKLPELPDGERYVYDPKAGELMVERPKR